MCVEGGHGGAEVTSPQGNPGGQESGPVTVPAEALEKEVTIPTLESRDLVSGTYITRKLSAAF